MTDSISNSSADAIVSEIIDAHARKVAQQTLRKVTPDEVVFVQALDFYNALTRDPQGMLHRQHANTLMWFLGHVTDEGLRQCADAGHFTDKMDNPRAVFANMAAKILKRRGVGRAAIIVN